MKVAEDINLVSFFLWAKKSRVNPEKNKAEGIKQSVNVDSLEQDISAATKIDVDVNLSEADLDIAGDLRKKDS